MPVTTIPIRHLVPLAIAASFLAAASALPAPTQQSAQQSTQQADARQSTAPPSSKPDETSPQSSSTNYGPRGKKLVLKDGSVQIVRSYEKKGDVVRYYSVEQSQWEEIPAALVDWDATEKAAAAEKTRADDLKDRAAKRDAQLNAGEVLDVDASLEVAPGVILPQDEGLFVVQGSRVAMIGQSQTTIKTDKKQAVKKILTPVPIIPERHDLEITGKSATLRLAADGPDPEFYLRVPYDSTEEPHILIIRAQLKGNNRVVDIIETNIAGENSNVHDEISIQRWIVAKGVFRYTLGGRLTPGEYAVEETVPSGVMMFVWDFGVDKGGAPAATPGAKPH
ncbi:MAG TPA: hypothetical protein VFO34_10510 [Candidatus Acidoferrales bacterium]|nr:hypothetical protein [Candidatus Acidoferrales bacterium]